MPTASPGLVPALIARLAGRLRFPQLFLFTAGLLALDLLIPDLIPFIDELVLGLVTLLLGMWRKEEPPAEASPKPLIKDITPPD